MDWTSFLIGVLVGGIVGGFISFALGATVGMLVGQKEARRCRFMDQLDEEVVYDAMEGLDFMLDESKRSN